MRTKWDPELMTFRCAGLALWPLGNHVKAKANASGLPRQTSRPRVNPPEPGPRGLPLDCGGWYPHLPTVDTAGTTMPSSSLTFSYMHKIVEGTWELLPYFSSVQSFSHVQLFATPWIAACQASLSITNSWSLLKLMSIESVMPSNHLI